MTSGKLDAKWAEKVQEWQVSGKTIKEWCKEQNIPVTTFYGWKSRVLDSNKNTKFPPKKRFIELKNQNEKSPGLILEYQGAKLYLEAEFDPILLKKCLECLRGVLC